MTCVSTYSLKVLAPAPNSVGFAKNDCFALQQNSNKRIILLSFMVFVDQTADLQCKPQRVNTDMTQPVWVFVHNNYAKKRTLLRFHLSEGKPSDSS